MAAHCSSDANAAVSLSQKVNRMVSGGSHDYNSWMSLILEIEASCPEDIDTISSAYDYFLSIFPLCHWHLKKYAYHKAKLCGAQEAVKIYEQGAETAMFSVGFWVDYFTFAASCFEDPEDVRRLFVRAVSFVEKDYFCHVLWDKYMKYEYNQGGWSSLALSYIKSLRFPSKKLHFYYDNFRQFAANLKEEIGHEKSNSMEVDQLSIHCTAAEMHKDEIFLIIKELLDSSDKFIRSKALDRYGAIGEEFYYEACQMEEKIKCFEKKILRRYFHLTPLDDDQLNNWHLYLNFIERVDDLDWAVKLYERCLIPCANYPEFWMRYVEFLESKGGRELAISALDRVAQIFLKEVTDIHQFSARFKEHTGDVDGARAALLQCESKTDSSFIENTVALANLERRLGNFAAACATYEKALETARQKRRLHVLPTLYARFAQLTFLTSGSAAAARDVLIEGVKRLPHCRYLLEELIKFTMTHEGAKHLNIIDPIIADVISPGSDEYEKLNAKDRENMSCLFLEYVNLCGTIHDIRKAWNRHIKLFPHYLRIKTTHKPWASGNHPSDRIRAIKGNDESAELDQPSRNQSSGTRLQLQGPEQVRGSSANDEIHTNQVLGRLSALENGNGDAKGTMQTVSHKAVVLSKQDASWNNGEAYGFSRQSREDNLGRIVFSAELSHQPKENAATMHEAGQSPHCKATGDNHGQIEGSSEISGQLNEDSLIRHERTEEAWKSPETTKSLQADLDDEFKQQPPLSLDNSLHSHGNEPQEPLPMPVDKNETPKVIPGKSTYSSTLNANTDAFPAPKSVQSENIHNQLEGQRSVVSWRSTTNINAQTEEPSSAGNNSLETGYHRAPATGHATSAYREQVTGQESWLGQYFYRDNQTANMSADSAQNMHTNLHPAEQNPEQQTHSQMQVGSVQVDKTTDKGQPAGNLMPVTDVCSGQTSGTSQLISYPISSTDQNSYQNNQHPWQTQQNLAMNQMLQCHYQQQQLLQQQYQQQQQQMQQAYIQMQQNYMTQQTYQMLPQQQNQQHVQPTNQQQQLQTHPYQLLQHQPHQQLQSSHYQQSPQMVGNLQLQQGKEPYLADQQANEKQSNQTPDLTYQTHQLAYQQYATQAQQILMQQYQQYLAYQHVQHQQQSQEGYKHMQEQQIYQHSVQKQQDELQQQQQPVFSTQNMNQNQQGSRSAPPDNSGASEPSKSPHLCTPSPKVLPGLHNVDGS